MFEFRLRGTRARRPFVFSIIFDPLDKSSGWSGYIMIQFNLCLNIKVSRSSLLLSSSMQKDFERWHQKKETVNDIFRPPFFHEREIWWRTLGVILFPIYLWSKNFKRSHSISDPTRRCSSLES